MPNSTILRPYWENKKLLTVIDKILMYDDRIVIPAGMRLEILDLLHQGHLGMTKRQDVCVVAGDYYCDNRHGDEMFYVH